MYLHKNGLKYYQNELLTIVGIIEQHNRINFNNLYDINGHNLMAIIKELEQHVNNITKELLSEENITQKFISNVGESFGNSFPEKSREQFFELKSKFHKSEVIYMHLGVKIQELNKLISSTPSSLDLTSKLRDITRILILIFNESQYLSEEFHKLISTMKKEEELIKKEKEVVEGFEKNLMSWLN